MNFDIVQLDGFADARCAASVWNTLLADSTNVVFLTHQWQESWWNNFDRTGLMLLGIYIDNELKAIAPFFTEEGMVYLVGSGGSDYLDLIGRTSSNMLEAILTRLADLVPNLIGIRLYHLPQRSATTMNLQSAAEHLGWMCRMEGGQVAPAADLHPGVVDALANKKSLLRHEKFFSRSGELRVMHFSRASDISPRLEQFFEQHIHRWSATSSPSLFLEKRQRKFYGTVTAAASDSGWLRFTEIGWNGRPIAFHFGFHYYGSFMWYKPTFEMDLARHSPGEVLLRHLLLEAKRENASTFDLGLGDETFKSRFANRVERVSNWGLYPPGVEIPEVW